MSTWFNLSTARGTMQCYSCAPYFPYRVDGERNPKFDRHSGLILSSKSAQERNFGHALNYFSDMLLGQISQWNLEGLRPTGSDPRLTQGRAFVDVIIVPSSKVGKVSDGLTQIMTKVCARDKRLSINNGALHRFREINKLASGGNRDAHVHQGSIMLRSGCNLSDVVILIDDVCTSGNSLIACCEIIQSASPSSTVVGIVLGKTTHD